MTEADFLKVYNRLCVALREQQDDSGMTQRIYFDALKDLSVEALQFGATALQRETGRRFFPTTAEWRDAARPFQASQRIALALPAGREQPWREECHHCGDTGWVEGLSCGGQMGTCGRAKAHLPHTYTEPCACRPTNRTYQRHQTVGRGAA